MNKTGFTILLVGACILNGCSRDSSPREEAQMKEESEMQVEKTSAADVQKEMAEAAEATAEYTREKVVVLKDSAERQIAEAQRTMEALYLGLAEMEPELKAKAEGVNEEIRGNIDELQDQLGRLADVTADEYAEAEARVQKLIVELKQNLSEAKANYTTDKETEPQA